MLARDGAHLRGEQGTDENGTIFREAGQMLSRERARTLLTNLEKQQPRCIETTWARTVRNGVCPFRAAKIPALRHICDQTFPASVNRKINNNKDGLLNLIAR